MAQRAGTSYATPVAAGVAAVVMDYVQSGWKGEVGEERYEFRTLRTERGVLAVLAEMIERD